MLFQRRGTGTYTCRILDVVSCVTLFMHQNTIVGTVSTVAVHAVQMYANSVIKGLSTVMAGFSGSQQVFLYLSFCSSFIQLKAGKHETVSIEPFVRIIASMITDRFARIVKDLSGVHVLLPTILDSGQAVVVAPVVSHLCF